MTLRNVSDTALWMATYRAMETERVDALFHDPYAERLAGDRGRAIVREMPQGASMAWSMSVRTAVIDDMLLACIAAGAHTVVNLGAGLDMRAFRLKLPASLHWFDVDLPETIAYRGEALKGVSAVCRHFHLEADLADADGLARVLRSLEDSKGPILILTEGLLIYLTPEAVSDMAVRLGLEARFRWWIMDLVSPRLLASVARQWHSRLETAKAPFLFAAENSRKFFGLTGWREREFRSTFEEAGRLGRPPPAVPWWDETAMAWWMTPPEERRRLSGVALMEPDE